MSVQAAPRRVERTGSFDAGPVFFIGAVIVLAILVIVPLAYLFAISLSHAEGGGLTAGNYVEAFTKSIYLRPILNSAILATSVATIAALIGTPLAWLIARTDLPGRKALRALITAAFVTPSFIGAEAWILLAAPNSGWINRAIASFTHAEHGPINIFSLGGAIFVMALYNVPYTFTFVAGGLELLSVDLEDASSTLGASAWRTMRSITLPLVMPAIIAGFIMSFLEALAEFGTPAFLLIPARTQVVTTQLYLFFQFPVRTELAAAYAMPLIAVTLLLLLVQRRILGRKQFTAVGGKGGGAGSSPLDRGAGRCWGSRCCRRCARSCCRISRCSRRRSRTSGAPAPYRGTSRCTGTTGRSSTTPRRARRSCTA